LFSVGGDRTEEEGEDLNRIDVDKALAKKSKEIKLEQDIVI